MIPPILFDKTVIHQTYLVRRANGISRDVLALLRDAEADIKAQIARVNPTGVAKRYQPERMAKLLESVQGRITELSKEFNGKLKADLSDLAKYEAGSQAAIMSAVISPEIVLAAPSATTLASLVTSTPIEGRLFSEWMKGWERATIDAMNQAIRIGVVEGETISEMANRVSAASGVRARSAEKIVRTSVTSVTNKARQELWSLNDDVVKGWVFIATLDSRTTIECASLHGKKYKIGEGPQPPRHINCRSTTVPDIGDDLLSAGSMQQSKDGLVSADISYTEWLRGQPASVQQDILGPARYKLFRDNKIPVDYFTNDAGRVLSLDELAKKDKSLFDK